MFDSLEGPMLESNTDVIYDHPSKIFVGVRFVLLGFDPISKNNARSRLISGGGVDVGQYSDDCTHVIVDKLAYDDPVCVAARADGKALVTALWVAHSFDVGMTVDISSIMYRPVRDLSGIPGAKTLVVCLTGYQRQDRDDIMTMVCLMGAQFSKPLVANKVTHLICYKFEGEKFELAKKMKKIKLVNHRWLEDCLKAWEILPEEKYDKSGFELEMEVEAKDSEDEAEDLAVCGKRDVISNEYLHVETGHVDQPLKPQQEVFRGDLNSSALKGLHNNSCTDDGLSDVGKISSEQASPLQENSKEHERSLGDAKGFKHLLCGEPSTLLDRTPTPIKVGNSVASSGSARISSHFDARMPISMRYSKKNTRGTPPSTKLGGIPSISDANNEFKAIDDTSTTSSRLKEDRDNFCSAKTPPRAIDLRFEDGEKDLTPGKRKMDVSYISSKSQKKNLDSTKMSGNTTGSGRTEEMEPVVTFSDSYALNIHNHNTDGVAEMISLEPELISPVTVARTKSPSSDGKLAESSMSKSKSVLPKIWEDSAVKVRPPTSPECGEASLSNNDIVRQENAVIHVHSKLHDTKAQSGTSESGTKEFNSSIDLLGEVKGCLSFKSLGKKKLADKNLGSGSKLAKGDVRNRKGSNHLNCSTEEKGNQEKKPESAPQDVDVSPCTMIEVNGCFESVKEVNDKIISMDDETEAPENEEENKSAMPIMKDESGKRETGQHPNVTEETSEVKHHLTLNPQKDESETRASSEVYGTKNVSDKSNEFQTGEDVKQKVNKRSLQSQRKSVSAFKKVRAFRNSNDGNSRSAKNTNQTDMKRENVANSVQKVSGEAGALMEIDKENRPAFGGSISVNHADQNAGTGCPRNLKRMDIKTADSLNKVQMKQARKLKSEPMQFILSGHRLQRKEFQRVIKDLKGRVCRDSHQWSYQATHFILPDPIRRTEKFFAAAASGRWILKTEYLTASSQKGRFLAEEPYEWHRKGLSEDGAINLEAPRKWRLLRERTGHGAFYGMRIIIYGECIAPPLDTLKRAVKAGDGAILATSPPYTRFLKSGVDYAIVSPGMPSVDLWVQEFLRHEIPCVVADYLVEYVCKPGFSLERHVQYNTHAWAEKSFKNQADRMEEVVTDDIMSPECDGNDDLQCQVCGSHERGEVMLICGNESGTSGCGVGTHIDCCDPPLEAVPDEDWFCDDCSRKTNGKNCNRRAKKVTSVSKK